jgi:hypothetical protein
MEGLGGGESRKPDRATRVPAIRFVDEDAEVSSPFDAGTHFVLSGPQINTRRLSLLPQDWPILQSFHYQM